MKKIPTTDHKCNQCIYGYANTINGVNCNFCECEHHCRTVKNGQSGYNPVETCEYFQKVTKDNPRRRAATDECNILRSGF